MAWHSAGHPHRAHVRAPGTKTVSFEEDASSFPPSRLTFEEEEEELERLEFSGEFSTSSARRFRTFSSYARHASNAKNPKLAPATGFEPATTFRPFGSNPGRGRLFPGRRYGKGGVPGAVPTAAPASQSAMDANAKHGG